MSKRKIAVLFGGMSSEHEVSLVSAASVMQKLARDQYEVIPIGITKHGHWLYYPGPLDRIPSGDWADHLDCCPAIISPDFTHHGIIKLLPDGTQRLLKVDCVLPILHGKNGEDGTVQGLLELSGIPYVGCDLLCSAVCMDKSMTHILLERAGVLMAKWGLICKSELSRLDERCEQLADDLGGFPIFIKPANAGSSVGITKATDLPSLRRGIILAFSHDKKVVCEQAIVGKEIECAVLGNESPRASVLGQIIPCNDFYDYEAKYQQDSRLLIPADVDGKTAARVQQIALFAYKELACTGLARVDFFVTERGEIYLNEINTLPGFTSISMYPKLWEKSKISFSKLLDLLIDLAVTRDENSSNPEG